MTTYLLSFKKGYNITLPVYEWSISEDHRTITVSATTGDQFFFFSFFFKFKHWSSELIIEEILIRGFDKSESLEIRKYAPSWLEGNSLCWYSCLIFSLFFSFLHPTDFYFFSLIALTHWLSMCLTQQLKLQKVFMNILLLKQKRGDGVPFFLRSVIYFFFFLFSFFFFNSFYIVGVYIVRWVWSNVCHFRYYYLSINPSIPSLSKYNLCLWMELFKLLN